MLGTQRLDVLDRLALARDECLNLMGELALRKQLNRKLTLGDHGSSRYVDLSPNRGPVEEQRDIRVGLDLARLASPERRGENQRLILLTLERDRPRRRPSTLTYGDERNRPGLTHTRRARLRQP